MFKGKKGFTLIELLIVMAVIAVLIGIAIPSFRGMQNEAKKAKAQGDMRVVKLAIEAYNAKYSAYPTALTTLESEATVLVKLPVDPFGTAYGYAVDASPAKYYAVWSVGADNVTTACTISTAGVVTVGGATQLGTTNGTSPNSNWK
ncbi:MAG: prepilin-type N-terminal cleavage/methylation domain-containing protein [Candidatus Margulisiibacteriota bacterium]